MNRAFADASHFFAILFDFDGRHSEAIRLSAEVAGWELYTSTEIVGEVLARASRRGEEARETAATWARGALTGTSDVFCLNPTMEQMLAAVDLYARRPDQRYSLVDCLSMTMMDELGIPTVLTFDRDFHGEGRYTVLPGRA